MKKNKTSAIDKGHTITPNARWYPKKGVWVAEYSISWFKGDRTIHEGLRVKNKTFETKQEADSYSLAHAKIYIDKND